MYADEPLKKYLDDLSAKTPAPGGGSVAALTAGLGAALISMVAQFTLGKPHYAQYEQEMKDILERSESLRKEFMRLVDLDVVAYQSKSSRDALNIPFMVARLCYEGIKICPRLIGTSNVNLISDVAVAVVLLESAFTSALVNVEINLKTLDDAQFALTVRKELEGKLSEVRAIRAETEEKVGAIIRG